MVIYPNAVTKIFDDPEKYTNELRIYLLNLPHVPQMLSHGEAEAIDRKICYITTQRVKGRAYLDDDSFDPAGLGTAIADFHHADMKEGKCWCHIDNQPQNILLSGNDFFFVDFSDSKWAIPETDLTHLLLFWAEEFAYSDFISISGIFLNSYQKIIPLTPKRWQQALKQSITRFDERRKQFNKKAPAADSAKNRKRLEVLV